MFFRLKKLGVFSLPLLLSLNSSQNAALLPHFEGSLVATRMTLANFSGNGYSVVRCRFDVPFTPMQPIRPSKEEIEALNAQALHNQKIVNEARLLLNQRRFAEAIKLGKTALDLIDGKPTNMDAVEFLGDVFLEQKRYEDAIENYNQVRKHSYSVELDLKTALAYVRLGDLKKAKEFYSEEKFFGDQLGVSFTESQKAEYFSQLPGTKDAKSFEDSLLYARGYEYDSHGNAAEAANYYQKLLEIYPLNGLFAYRLADNLMDLKRYDEALPMWARAAKFGKGENARDALNRTGGWPAAKREKAIADAAKLK